MNTGHFEVYIAPAYTLITADAEIDSTAIVPAAGLTTLPPSWLRVGTIGPRDSFRLTTVNPVQPVYSLWGSGRTTDYIQGEPTIEIAIDFEAGSITAVGQRFFRGGVPPHAFLLDGRAPSGEFIGVYLSCASLQTCDLSADPGLSRFRFTWASVVHGADIVAYRQTDQLSGPRRALGGGNEY